MPVNMTEITPQTPNGAVKINVEVGNIVAELDLVEGLPVESTPESQDFTQVGQIIRKMVPLDLPIQRATAQPPSIDVELPVAKPPNGEASQNQPRQILVAESKVPTKVASTEETEGDPQPIGVIPSVPASSAQISSSPLIANVPEEPSIQVMPFVAKPRNNLDAVESFDGRMPAKDLGPRHAFTRLQSNARQSAMPDSSNVVSGISSELKPSTAAEVLHDFSDFGSGISDKPLAQRPLPSVVPTVPANATQAHTAETKIISQISTAISNTSKDTVEIRLDPPELGRVIISITQSDSGLSATVTSEKAEIADLLRRHAELLSRELSKSGFHEASLEFSHRDQQQGRPTFEVDENRLSSVSPEQAKASSAIEMILRSQSGSLDIRL